MTRADLDKEPHEVAAMFDGVAERYDLTNDVLSLGQTRLWRRAVARAVDAQPGERVLDLAAGTGSSSLPFAAAGAQVVAVRLLPRHAPGRQARRTPTLDLLAGDALRLPFADGVFDAVTISFGLRNVSDVDGGARRDGPGDPAGRPAGRLRVQPPDLARRSAPSTPSYLMRGAAVGGPPGLQQPGRLRLPRRVDPGLAGPAGAGASGSAPPAGPAVGWRNLTGGIVALHRAHRPRP